MSFLRLSERAAEFFQSHMNFCSVPEFQCFILFRLFHSAVGLTQQSGVGYALCAAGPLAVRWLTFCNQCVSGTKIRAETSSSSTPSDWWGSLSRERCPSSRLRWERESIQSEAWKQKETRPNQAWVRAVLGLRFCLWKLWSTAVENLWQPESALDTQRRLLEHKTQICAVLHHQA